MPYDAVKFGSNVKRLRQERGLTHSAVEKIAEQNGFRVSQPTLSKMENGGADDLPTGRIILGLSYALNQTPNELLGLGETIDWAAPTTTLGSVRRKGSYTGDVKDIADMVQTLPDELREQTKVFVDHLIKVTAIKRQRNLFYFKDLLEILEAGLDPVVRDKVVRALKEAGVAPFTATEQRAVEESAAHVRAANTAMAPDAVVG